MTATANGLDILNLLITEPRVGVWTAELDVDSDVALSGSVTIDVDGVTWKGTVARGDVVSGRAHAYIKGGAGKLSQQVDAKYYVGVTMQTVLADITGETGEQLSAAVDPDVLSFTVDRWARSRAGAGQALRQVADALGVTWRVLRDGSIWLGTEVWPDAQVVYDETDQAPSQGAIVIAPDSPTLTPGEMFAGKGVSRVLTHVSARGVRQEALFEDDTDGSGLGRFARDVASVVEALVGNRIDYSRFYPAQVVKQSDDGTLELLADNPRIRGTGITRVPIRHGIPGVVVKVPAGGHVLLFFEDGNPSKPAAGLWPDGTSVSEIKITVPKLTVDGDLLVTGEVTAKSANPLTAVALSTHLHPTAMGPSDKPTPGT